jgi:hypothetical protein
MHIPAIIQSSLPQNRVSACCTAIGMMRTPNTRLIGDESERRGEFCRHDRYRRKAATGTRSGQKEPELERLAGKRKKREFFHQIIPLLRSLKSYIKRHLRVAYLTLHIRTQVAKSGDILDEVILYVYNNYSRKPEDLTLEQWLYQTANRKLKNYISKQKSKEKRRTAQKGCRGRGTQHAGRNAHHC